MAPRWEQVTARRVEHASHYIKNFRMEMRMCHATDEAAVVDGTVLSVRDSDWSPDSCFDETCRADGHKTKRAQYQLLIL